MVLVKKDPSVDCSWHKTISKLRQIRALFSLRSYCTACERALLVISNQTKWRPPQSSVSGLLSACMRAEHFALQLQFSGWRILLLTKLSALLAQETTKSHHYLDYIMGPPTHAACPRYSDRDVYTGQDSWAATLCHCLGHYQKAVQVYDAGLGRQHACLQYVFPSSTGGQTPLLAVMLAEEGRTCSQSLLLYLRAQT